MDLSTRGLGPKLDRSFDQIEDSILPSVGLLLDCLLDAAASARPGTDCEAQAGELRLLARHVEELSRRVESLVQRQLPEPARMSA
jgi:hypothetical protein